MASFKKGLVLLVCLCLLKDVYPLNQAGQTPDSLLKEAGSSKNILQGIKLAKQACAAAALQNNNVVVIKALNLTAWLYYTKRQYDSTKVYAQNALSAIAQYHVDNLTTDSLKADSWQYLAMADFGLGAFKQSIDEYEKSTVLYKKTRQLYSAGISYLNIGISQSRLSQYSQAINSFLLSAAIFENLKYEDNLADDFNAIASCFTQLNEYPKAVAYHKKALAIRLKFKDKEPIAESLNNLGYAFKQYGKTDSAIYYLSRSLAMRKGVQDSSVLVLTLQNLGSSWKIKGNLAKAERYILRAQNIAPRYSMKEELARGNIDLADVYIGKKKYDDALAAINSTLATARQLKLPQLIMEAYGTEYNLYYQKGDYKTALYYSNKRNALNDSLFTIQKNRTIQELDVKYQTSQKEKDIAALVVQNGLGAKIVRQQRLSITMLIIAAALLLLLFAIAYNSFRIKNKANLRIQTLMQDMHHRVKNNLQILSALFTMQIENLSDENTKNTLRENEARLTSMNLIHNKLYLDRSTTKIEMEEYLTKLLNHIKDSFGGNRQREINLRIEIDHIMFEADKAVAIGLLVNELATNAFKYAFTDKGGEIFLGLKLLERSKMLLTLSDNGVGLEKDKEKDKDRAPSFGLRLVNLMARQLNSTLVVKNDNGMCYQLELKM